MILWYLRRPVVVSGVARAARSGGGGGGGSGGSGAPERAAAALTDVRRTTSTVNAVHACCEGAAADARADAAPRRRRVRHRRRRLRHRARRAGTRRQKLAPSSSTPARPERAASCTPSQVGIQPALCGRCPRDSRVYSFVSLLIVEHQSFDAGHLLVRAPPRRRRRLGLAPLLRPLAVASKIVPAAEQPTALVMLKATAGMRMVKADARERIYTSLLSAFRSQRGSRFVARAARNTAAAPDAGGRGRGPLRLAEHQPAPRGGGRADGGAPRRGGRARPRRRLDADHVRGRRRRRRGASARRQSRRLRAPRLRASFTRTSDSATSRCSRSSPTPRRPPAFAAGLLANASPSSAGQKRWEAGPRATRRACSSAAALLDLTASRASAAVLATLSRSATATASPTSPAEGTSGGDVALPPDAAHFAQLAGHLRADPAALVFGSTGTLRATCAPSPSCDSAPSFDARAAAPADGGRRPRHARRRHPMALLRPHVHRRRSSTRTASTTRRSRSASPARSG